MKNNPSVVLCFLCMTGLMLKAEAQTYAEKLGWEAEQKLLIMHVDDAGMSYDSNQGAIQAMENGVANSVSIMMPCSWAASFVKYAKANPDTDAGLHLTLTSEWKDYRWGPLSGIPAVPGLVDQEGALWHTVEQVATHASADEVEQEIRQQVERALAMDYQPTHLDSHMGTLFATEDFLQRYIKVGVDYDIPVMIPGGHNTLLKRGYQDQAIRQLKKAGTYQEGMEVPLPEAVSKASAVGEMVWQAGLPVLDDLHTTTGDWSLPEGVARNEANIHELKVRKFKELFRADATRGDDGDCALHRSDGSISEDIRVRTLAQGRPAGHDGPAFEAISEGKQYSTHYLARTQSPA